MGELWRRGVCWLFLRLQSRCFEFDFAGVGRHLGHLLYIFKEECYGSPEQKPGDRHDPRRTRKPVENDSIPVGPKANPVKHSSKKGAERETGSLSDDEVSRESSSPTDSNDAWIRTVLLRVHEESETDPRDHAPDEDQVEKVRPVSEGVAKTPDDRRETTEVDRDFVTA